MPRLWLEGVTDKDEKTLDNWNEKTGDGVSNYDICTPCFYKIKNNREKYINHPKFPPFNGEPEGINYQLSLECGDHPLFEDHDYTCDLCETILKDFRDNTCRECRYK